MFNDCMFGRIGPFRNPEPDDPIEELEMGDSPEDYEPDPDDIAERKLDARLGR